MIHSDELEGLLKAGGADLVGFGGLGALSAGSWTRCVALAVRLPASTLCGISEGPTYDYYEQYHALNAKLDRLAGLAASYHNRAGLPGPGPDHYGGGRVRRVPDPLPPQNLRHPERAGVDREIRPAGHAGIRPGGAAQLRADGRALRPAGRAGGRFPLRRVHPLPGPLPRQRHSWSLMGCPCRAGSPGGRGSLPQSRPRPCLGEGRERDHPLREVHRGLPIYPEIYIRRRRFHELRRRTI